MPEPLKQVCREAAFDPKDCAIDETQRTVALSFSSELPVYDAELKAFVILDHSPGACDLSRLEGGAVLVQHDQTDQVGAVAECQIDGDRKGRAIVRMSKGTRGSEIFQDVKDGIRRLVSVRADILKYVVEKVENGIETLRATLWRPKEISFVSIPADHTVGVGRSEPVSAPAVIDSTASTKKDQHFMAELDLTKLEPEVQRAIARGIETERAKFQSDANKRIGDINAAADKLAKDFPEGKETFRGLATKAITEGTSASDFNMQLLAAIPGVRTVTREEAPVIGLTEKETKRFSVLRAIHALATNDWKAAGFELECSRAVEKLAGTPKHGGFYVPYEIQVRPSDVRAPEVKRDLTVGTANAGGYLVATQNMAGSFIDLLRNRTLVAQLGARIMSGLRDNVTIPKLTAGATGYWLSTEATQITESQQTLGQLALTPKTVGAYTEISRLLMLQSNPSADALVMDDLAKVVAIAVDLGALAGSGSSGQPTGVIATSGIGAVTGTSMAYAGILEFQTDVAGANALTANCAYITTPTIAALLAARQRFSSTDTPLWKGNILDGEVSGFRAATTLQVPTGDILFGDFSSIVIGEWGILELAMNPYANFTAGIVGVRAFQTVDVGVRYAGSFSLATSVT